MIDLKQRQRHLSPQLFDAFSGDCRMLLNTDASPMGIVRRGNALFTAQWPNDRAFWLGVYAQQGLTSTAICARLDEGIAPGTVTAMLSQWGFRLPPSLPRTYGPVTANLCAKDRTRLDAEARARGIDMPTLCERLLSIAARDQLVAAILER